MTSFCSWCLGYQIRGGLIKCTVRLSASIRSGRFAFRSLCGLHCPSSAHPSPECLILRWGELRMSTKTWVGVLWTATILFNLTTAQQGDPTHSHKPPHMTLFTITWTAFQNLSSHLYLPS